MYKVIWSNGYGAHSIKAEKEQAARDVYEAVKALEGVTYAAIHRVFEDCVILEESVGEKKE